MSSLKTFLLIFCLSFHSAISQENIHVTWGNPFGVDMLDRLNVSYLGNDNEGSFVVFRNQESNYGSNEKAYFCKIDAKGEIILQTDLLVKYNNDKHAKYEGVFNIKGNMYLFTSFWDRASQTAYIWANKIDSKGNLIMPSIELSKQNTAFDNFDFRLSQDSSYLVFRKGQLFKVFDKDLSERWSKQIILPYSNAKIRELHNYSLSNKNVLHIMCRFSLLGEGNTDNKKPTEYFYNISNFNLETDQQTEYLPKIDSAFLSGLSLELDGNSNLILAGFYSLSNKQVKPMGEYEYYYSSGLFFKKYDPMTDKEIIAVQYPYTADVLRQLVSDKKTDSGEEVLWGLSMENIKFRADGSIILVAQKTHTHALTSNGSISGASYQFEQLITASLDNKGALVWMRVIPTLHSSMRSYNLRYYSYLLGVTNSSVYFIYNENPRNATIVDPRDYVYMDEPTKCMTSMVKIDSSGTVTKERIFENMNKKEITYLEPTYSIPVNNTRYIILSSSSSISKIGLLDFSDH
ncbi:MAG: hypothetical protein JWM14_423 [Chitinophagaceae bacterium]|nr:hypothetical protein [Chitinophagaceae bacterium]